MVDRLFCTKTCWLFIYLLIELENALEKWNYYEDVIISFDKMYGVSDHICLEFIC